MLFPIIFAIIVGKEAGSMELTIEQIQENRIRRLKEARKASGLSLNDVASALHINKSTLARWENGIINGLKLPHLKKLAELYGVSEQWLFGYDVPRVQDSEKTNEIKGRILDLIDKASDEDLMKIKAVLDVFLSGKNGGDDK